MLLPCRTTWQFTSVLELLRFGSVSFTPLVTFVLTATSVTRVVGRRGYSEVHMSGAVCLLLTEGQAAHFVHKADGVVVRVTNVSTTPGVSTTSTSEL